MWFFCIYVTKILNEAKGKAGRKEGGKRGRLGGVGEEEELKIQRYQEGSVWVLFIYVALV